VVDVTSATLFLFIALSFFPYPCLVSCAGTAMVTVGILPSSSTTVLPQLIN